VSFKLRPLYPRGLKQVPLILMGERRLRVFENRVPRKIFEPKRVELKSE